MSESGDDILKYTQSNRRAWNEIAQVRSTTQPPAEFFADGNSILHERELQAVGDVRGRRLLHLQCATGEGTLSWSVAGAEAIGVDISEEQIAANIDNLHRLPGSYLLVARKDRSR